MPFMKHGFALITGASALALLGSAGLSYGQVKADDLDRSEFRTSAHALGLGGSDILLTDGIDSAAANPAAMGDAGHFSASLSIVANTDNIKPNDVRDLGDNLKKLQDQVDGTVGGSAIGHVSNASDAFEKVYEFASKAGAKPDGGAANLKANIAPLLGFSLGRIGVVAYGGLSGDIRLSLSTGTGPGLGTVVTDTFGGLPHSMRPSALSIGDKRKIVVDGGALGMSTIAVPFAITLPFGTVGVSPKFVRADYAPLNYTADASNDLISGTKFDSVSDQKPDLDLGFSSKSFNGLRYAAVVRNVLQPSFHLKRRVKGVDTPGNFDFTNGAQFDLGGMYTKNNLSFVAEEHNLSGANGGSSSFHTGVEYRMLRMFAFRVGYDRDRVVAGLGVNLGGFHLDVASSSDPNQRAAVSLSSKF